MSQLPDESSPPWQADPPSDFLLALRAASPDPAPMAAAATALLSDRVAVAAVMKLASAALAHYQVALDAADPRVGAARRALAAGQPCTAPHDVLNSALRHLVPEPGVTEAVVNGRSTLDYTGGIPDGPALDRNGWTIREVEPPGAVLDRLAPLGLDDPTIAQRVADADPARSAALATSGAPATAATDELLGPLADRLRALDPARRRAIGPIGALAWFLWRSGQVTTAELIGGNGALNAMFHADAARKTPAVRAVANPRRKQAAGTTLARFLAVAATQPTLPHDRARFDLMDLARVLDRFLARFTQEDFRDQFAAASAARDQDGQDSQALVALLTATEEGRELQRQLALAWAAETGRLS